MKHHSNRVLLSVLAVALLVSPASRSWGQEKTAAPASVKPAVVVSVASADRLLGGLDYLAKAAGVTAQAMPLRVMAESFLAGLDRSKPAGAYVSISADGQPAPVGFVPAKDLQTLLKPFLGAFQAKLGQPQDAGGGILKLAADSPQPLFLKSQGAWVLLSSKAEALAGAPQDLDQLLGGLEKQYDIAVRVLVQNIPAELRKKAVAQMGGAMQMAMKRQSPAAKQAVDSQTAEKLSQNSLQSIAMLVEEADQVTFGWGVDSQKKHTFFEFSMAAKPGTALANRMARLKGVKSAFAGFLLPDAAATLHSASRLDQQDIEQTTATLTVIRQKALAELDKDANLDDEKVRAAAKDVLGTFLDVISATVKEGAMDGGAALLLAPKSITLAAGLHVSDGAALEGAFRKLVDIAKTEPDFPGVQFDADKQADVRFHTMSAPVPASNPQLQQLIGDRLEVAVGFGPKSIHLAVGQNCLPLLKQVIEKSAADADKELPASQINAALGPIAQFAASIAPTPVTEALAAAAQQSAGADRLKIESRVTDQGVIGRLELQEGVLRVIGQAIQVALLGGSPPPKP